MGVSAVVMGHPEITGLQRSLIMTLKEQVAEFPAASVTFTPTSCPSDPLLQELPEEAVFIDQDTPENMYKSAGLDAKSIEDKILDLINSNFILQKQK